MCDDCARHGLKFVEPQLRSCFSCLSVGIKCHVIHPILTVMDCATKQLQLQSINAVKESTRKSFRAIEDYHMYTADPTHQCKSWYNSMLNWTLFDQQGQAHSMRQLRSIFFQ